MFSAIKKWWSEPQEKDDGRKAHMTFARTTMGNRIQRTTLLLRRQLWIWPILAVLLLSLIGYLITRSIRLTMEANLQSQLTTLLEVEKSMVLKWLSQQETSARTLANQSDLRQYVEKLVKNNRKLNTTSPSDSIEDVCDFRCKASNSGIEPP